MSYKTLKDKDALSYLRAFGLTTTEACQLIGEIRKWETESGVEWTIKRLKSLKVAYIRKLGGLDPWTYATWIARKPNGKPSGPFGRVFSLPAPKALGCLMIYTMYIAKSPTESQLRKFEEAVCSVTNEPYTSQEIMDILMEIPLGQTAKLLKPASFTKLSAWYKREIRVPRFVDEDLNKVKSTPMSLEVLLETASHPLAQKFMRNLSIQKEIPDWLYQVYAKSGAFPDGIDYADLEENVIGQIGMIQEPGFKLRTIANPFPIFQVLLSRLGNQVYDLLRHIPEDCTFDQSRGISEIQEALKGGMELVAFDLSSATDRFPADITFKLLKAIGCKEADIELFIDISRGQWILPSGKRISWSNGQPLGVFPSFGAFALSHHMVIQTLKPRFYRILGDDLVISKECYESALKLYAKLGVPISMDKSIDSPVLTEFGGRVISSSKIYGQPKWREISDRSFVDLARSIGPSVFHILRPRQARVIRILADIPSTISPYGLNWNPKGLSYNERVDKASRFISLLNSVHLDSVMDSLAENNQLLYESMHLTMPEYRLKYFDIRSERNCTSNWGAMLDSDVKRRVLAVSNIRYLKISDGDWDILNVNFSNWRLNQVIFGDPRGIPLLERLEKALFINRRSK